LLALCLASVFPAVIAAPTTTIYQINGPSSAVAGSESPLSVVVTVYYNNTVAGYRLVVGVLDADLSPARIVSGIVVSYNDPCANEPEGAAVCAITVPMSSGVERLGFQIGGIFGGGGKPGSWDLNVTSILMDSQNNLIPGSASSKLFKINLTAVALSVDAPPYVAVSIDGVTEPAGFVSIDVALGQHNITVPQFVNVSQSTRLRFDQWSDGNPSAHRIIMVTNSTYLKADYVIQNLLTLIGVQGNVTVSNWYDADENGTFSTSQYEPIPGVLGAFGVRQAFRGWYENGRLLTDSPNGIISMDTPHTLTAFWQADYSIPTELTLGIIALVIIILLFTQRKNRNRRRRSKRRRKRSR
jgi:hypothetical protein